MKLVGKILGIVAIAGVVGGIIGSNFYFVVKDMKTKDSFADSMFSDSIIEEDFSKMFEAMPIEYTLKMLQDLGLSEINETISEDIAESWNSIEYPEEILIERIDQISYIAYYLGGGDYDCDTWEFTPTSKQVYVFDMEVFNIDKMYTDFLRAVENISCGEIVIGNIEESYMDDFSEKRPISFELNGQQYTYEVINQTDWFDVTFIGKINQILENEGIEKKLLVMPDNGQGCILFYNTLEWAEKFYEKLGEELTAEFE